MWPEGFRRQVSSTVPQPLSATAARAQLVGAEPEAATEVPGRARLTRLAVRVRPGNRSLPPCPASPRLLPREMRRPGSVGPSRLDQVRDDQEQGGEARPGVGLPRL